jgi:hypothetical protein
MSNLADWSDMDEVPTRLAISGHERLQSLL